MMSWNEGWLPVRMEWHLEHNGKVSCVVLREQWLMSPGITQAWVNAFAEAFTWRWKRNVPILSVLSCYAWPWKPVLKANGIFCCSHFSRDLRQLLHVLIWCVWLVHLKAWFCCYWLFRKRLHGVRMISPRFDVMYFHLLESQQVVNLSPDSKAGEVKKWLISKGFSERLVGCPQSIYFPTEKRQIILHTYHVYLVSVIHKAAYLTDSQALKYNFFLHLQTAPYRLSITWCQAHCGNIPEKKCKISRNLE